MQDFSTAKWDKHANLEIGANMQAQNGGKLQAQKWGHTMEA